MFFNFQQNNSGGYFTKPAHHVWVEADSADEANKLAEENGIYFNGRASRKDCNCCGDRWSRCYADDGEEFPLLESAFLKKKGIPSWAVYYKNGEVKESEDINV